MCIRTDSRIAASPQRCSVNHGRNHGRHQRLLPAGGSLPGHTQGKTTSLFAMQPWPHPQVLKADVFLPSLCTGNLHSIYDFSDAVLIAHWGTCALTSPAHNIFTLVLIALTVTLWARRKPWTTTACLPTHTSASTWASHPGQPRCWQCWYHPAASTPPQHPCCKCTHAFHVIILACLGHCSSR